VSVDIRLTDNIDAEIERIEGGTEHLIAQLAMRVRDVAKDNLHVGYGVDTGAMQESISAVTSEGSDYAEHVANAAGMNSKAEFAAEPALNGPLEAYTVVPVNYAAHVEYGGANPAQPFFTPALELVASEADNIARESFDLEGIHRT
jgi:hypothetical protein